MAASGPTIVARFLADTSRMTSEVDSATNKTGSKIAGWAKTAAIAVGGAFAVDAVVQFGKASVQAAADDAAAQAQLAASLKNTTGATQAQIDAAETYIGHLSKQTAIADDDLRPALATLARGFHDTAKAQDALSLATDISAGTGKDLATVSEALQKAANGNVGGLARLGIATKDATGKTKSLDQIMADLSRTFRGQAATAAETTAGKVRGAQIQFGEFQEQIGTALLPTLATLSGFLVNDLIPAFSAVADWIGGHKEIILSALIAMAVVVGGVVIPAFIAWAGAAAVAAASTLLAIAPFIAIGAVIAGVAYIIIHNWSTIVAVSKAAWAAVTGAVSAAFNWVRKNWPLLLAIITGPIGAATLLVIRNWNTIKGAAMAAFDWVRSHWPLLLAVITGPIGVATLAVIRNWDTIKGAATALYNWVKGKFDALGSAISAVVGGIASAVARVVSAIKAPMNAVIGAWNRLEFRIPSFTVPKISTPLGDIGGGTFGGQTIGFPDLPRLATGGVLTSPTVFLGGEAGTEIVAPEALLRSILREEGGGRNYTLNLYPKQVSPSDVAYAFRRLEMMGGVL